VVDEGLTAGVSNGRMTSGPFRVLLICLALFGAASAARAEDSPVSDAAAQQRKALEEARESLKETQERRQRLAAEIEALKGERGKLQASLIDTVASIRDRERQVEERAGRIDDMAESERQLKASLARRRGVLADVIAALQRMGRQPPPALLVRPDDALEAIRSAILLGAVVPDMRTEAESLASDLREMARLKEMLTGERDAMAGELKQLGGERERLAALVDERQRQLGQREGDLSAEADKAATITHNVSDLEALIARMEQEQASRAAAEAAKAPPAEPGGQRTLASLHDSARLAPAIPFAEARGMLPLPVAGKRLRTFGQRNGAGGEEQGVSFAASPGAPVTAPCDGWVVYAGPFRSYGELLILNAGGGYHILLAGMERITVGLNQFVLAGEPVGTMRGDAAASGQAATSPTARPVLYVEFRKDRGSIDPSPWWAGIPGEKVGG